LTEDEAMAIAHEAGERIVKKPVCFIVTPGSSELNLRLKIWKRYAGVDVIVIHSVPLVVNGMFERLCEVQWTDMLRTMEERWPSRATGKSGQSAS
jgi:hypothetical protein